MKKLKTYVNYLSFLLYGFGSIFRMELYIGSRKFTPEKYLEQNSRTSEKFLGNILELASGFLTRFLVYNITFCTYYWIIF